MRRLRSAKGMVRPSTSLRVRISGSGSGTWAKHSLPQPERSRRPHDIDGIPLTVKGASHMAGYLIAEVEITDLEAYERYRPLAAAAIARHGGKYIVRGG